MSIQERNDLCEKIWEAIGSDEYLYELLPGDGQDDFILDNIRKIINKVRLEYPPT